MAFQVSHHHEIPMAGSNGEWANGCPVVEPSGLGTRRSHQGATPELAMETNANSLAVAGKLD